MNWAAPAWFGLLPAVLASALVLVFAARAHRRRLAGLLRGEVLERVLPPWVLRRRTARDVLAMLGLTAAVLALAEPRFDKEIRTLRARGTDLVIVLDLSASMDARDVDPSRLGRARREIADLVRVVEQDRLGLVVVAGGAYPRLPLTMDRGAFELVVDELATDLFEVQGSALGEGLRVALEQLQRGDQKAGQAILVISDGECHDPEDARAAARAAAEVGVPVFAVGVGEEASPIPLADGGVLSHQGQVVTTTPNPDLLKDLARITGGAYVRSVATSTDMERLYRAEIRRKLTAVERTSTQREVWRSAFQWPLSAATMLLLAAAWMGDGRALLALVVALGLATSAPAPAGDLADADRAYRKGDHADAVRDLTELALERPDDPEVLERLGAARYRDGDYEGAARAWEQSADLRGEEDADLLFNIGNADYLAGGLERAAERYERALELEPGHQGARANREAVVAELAERRKPKQDPPPQPGEQGDEGSEPPEDPSGGEPGDPGEQPTAEAPSQADPTEGNPEDGTAAEEPPVPGAEGGPDSLQPAEPITEGEAHRLLEGVEEGHQRLEVGGEAGDKPW